MEDVLIPEASANWFSILVFGWITSLLVLDYARPLEAADLYKFHPDREATHTADRINASFNQRQTRADAFNAKLVNVDFEPSWVK